MITRNFVNFIFYLTPKYYCRHLATMINRVLVTDVIAIPSTIQS